MKIKINPTNLLLCWFIISSIAVFSNQVTLVNYLLTCLVCFMLTSVFKLKSYVFQKKRTTIDLCHDYIEYLVNGEIVAKRLIHVRPLDLLVKDKYDESVIYEVIDPNPELVSYNQHPPHHKIIAKNLLYPEAISQSCSLHGFIVCESHIIQAYKENRSSFLDIYRKEPKAFVR